MSSFSFEEKIPSTATESNDEKSQKVESSLTAGTRRFMAPDWIASIERMESSMKKKGAFERMPSDMWT